MTNKKKPPPPVEKTAAKPAVKTAAPAAKQAEPAGPSLAAQQLADFQDGVRLFTQKHFEEACSAFGRAAKGPAAHIADKARSYLQVCERKVSKPELSLRTAEDHFNYGVERLNARDMELARFHLDRALSLDPNADHIFYTMALSCGLAGDGNGACENLKRAIELEPRNRILARQDPEFTSLAHQYPALRTLLDSSSPA